MIEQLWYTRLPGSATRPPGFQIVAASPGLTDPRAKLTAAAIRLCRYDAAPRSAPPRSAPDGSAPAGSAPAGSAPAGSAPARQARAVAPVSFGWVDAGGVRFCFRRCPAGTDELGRPGNMTAHVLAGPPELLPAAAVMARFGSDWWWDGKVPPGLDLPPLESLVAVPPATSTAGPDADRRAAFLDALLTRQPRTLLTVRADPPEVAALVLAVEEAVPGLMDAHGVSTYEGPRTGGWFDVVGVAAAAPVPGAVPVAARPQARTPREVSAARDILLSGDRVRVTRTAARAAGIGTREAEVTRLPALITAYSELDAGAVPSAEFLASSLASTTIALLTLEEFPDAPHHVARELLRERGRVFDALAKLAGDGLDADALAAIGTAAGRELTASGTARYWELPLARLARAAPVMGTACRREILERASAAALDGAGTGTRLALLRQAAADGRSESHPAVAQLLASPRDDWHLIAGDRGLPARWRAITLASAYSGHLPPQPAQLARRLAADPAVAGPLAGLLPDTGPLRAAVGAVAPADRAGFLLAIAPFLPDGVRDELLCWHARGLAWPEARLDFMTRAAHQPTPGWTELLTATIAGYVRRRLAEGFVPWPEPSHEALLAAAAADPGAAAWRGVLQLAGHDDPHVTPLKSAIAAATRLPPPQDDDAVRCAVTFFAARGPSAEQFARALAALDTWTGDSIAVLVDACLHVIRSERDPRPAAQLAICLLGVVDRSGPEAGRAFSAPFRQLVRQLPFSFRDELEYQAAKLRDPAHAWWKQETGVFARAADALRDLRRRPD